MSLKILKAAFAGLVLSICTSANAGIITWDILTDYYDLTGTITFDDAGIAGLVDGDYDANDTHLYSANVSLFSNDLSIDKTFEDVIFQPLTNTFDNKHIDIYFDLANGTGLIFGSYSDSGDPAFGVSDYWLEVYEPNATYNSGEFHWAFSDDNNVNNDSNLGTIPEPSTLAIFALGMMGLATRRIKKN